ncbi:MAG TPA: FadD3 family acyl-CoA ligase [Acidimicrobiales bacterium]|nr:FadD3 family acyl-CoA ligase [Acidimicrobiales bacterium]
MRGDLEWGTLPGLAAEAARRFGGREAVVDGDVTLTFAELNDSAQRAARAFLAAGIEPGDRVGIWAPNCHQWVTAMAGLHAAGAVIVPVNTRFKGAEAAHVLNTAGAKLVLTVGEFLGADYVAMLRDAGVDTDAVRLDNDEWLRFLDGADSFAGALPEVKPDDISDILFTSGTTGRPKGAMCTHAQTLRAFEAWSDVVGLREGDRYLVVNPFFHSFGYKAGIVASLMRGATIVPHAVFDPATALARVAEEQITMLPGPPALYQSILNDPRLSTFDVSSLRLAVTGAAVIPVELIHRMSKELGFETVVTGYGLTECSGIATMCRHDDDPETIATTSGRAIPDVEVVVADDGEVLVRGYNVMQGYYEDTAATAETIDADGWLHTGDIGVMDDRGYLKITDRKKDLFIVGGFNAYPAEIENLMLANEKIAQVAVVGVPDERLGEVGMAFVILRAGESATPDELVAWCREHMANFKAPRHIEIVEALPLNASGKVLKFELRAQARELLASNE